jgi:hypothetical protein
MAAATPAAPVAVRKSQVKRHVGKITSEGLRT